LKRLAKLKTYLGNRSFGLMPHILAAAIASSVSLPVCS